MKEIRRTVTTHEDGTTTTEEVEVDAYIPEQITPMQARLELLARGLLQYVDEALAAIPDDAQRQAAQIMWEYATQIDRNNPLVRQLAAAQAQALGRDLDDVLDEFFYQAAKRA